MLKPETQSAFIRYGHFGFLPLLTALPRSALCTLLCSTHSQSTLRPSDMRSRRCPETKERKAVLSRQASHRVGQRAGLLSELEWPSQPLLRR